MQNTGAKNKKGWFSKDDLWPFHLCFGFLAIMVFIGFIKIGQYSPSHDKSSQIFFSLVFLYLGYWYSRLREHLPGMFLGILAIGAGMYSNWIQIGKIMANYLDRGERTIIVFAGLAVIAHGFQQIRRAKSGLEVED